MTAWQAFFSGLFLGTFMGMAIISLCRRAAQSDYMPDLPAEEEPLS